MMIMVVNSISISLLAVVLHVGMQVDAGCADSSSDVAFIGSVMVKISDGELSFPACTVFLGSFG